MAKKEATISNSVYFDPREIKIVSELHGKEGRFNPRTLSNPGFTSDKMEELRSGIISDGIQHALLVYMKGNQPHLVAGERRLRVILGLVEQDEEAVKLIKQGKEVSRVLVKNPRNGKMEPALQVYVEEGVECKISDAKDEKDRIRQAIQENTLHEGLTDYELLLQCEKMDKANISRAEQAAIMGVSEAWISQSHSLLESHQCITSSMEKGLLTRTAALTFLNVPHEKVSSVLKRAIDLTFQQAEEKEREAVEELAKATKEIEVGETLLGLTKFTGNQESARKARRQIARASKTVAKTEEKIQRIKANKQKKVTVETINTAAKMEDAADNLGTPQSIKHVRDVVAELKSVLENQDDNFVTLNDDEYDREDVDLVIGVLDWVVNRNHCEHPLNVVQLVRNGKPLSAVAE